MIILLLIGLAVLCLFLWIGLREVPEGYEDENGFHYGKKENDYE